MYWIYPRNVPKSVVPCIRLLFCPGMLLIHFDLIWKYVIAGKTAFKLKLRPESTKVVAASVNLVVEKTESDPRLPVDSGLPAGIEDPLIDETLSVHIPEVVPSSSSTQKPQALRLGQSREDLQSEHEEDKKSDSGAESPSFDPPPKPPPRTIVRLDTQLSTPMPGMVTFPLVNHRSLFSSDYWLIGLPRSAHLAFKTLFH